LMTLFEFLPEIPLIIAAIVDDPAGWR